ncbi:hypothetical protein LTS09_009716 [Friedmanniomyces endolithicus]|nr:hypothetical protein LTS09_009716 [Friedmanniomyces endolithicus]
MATGTRHKHTFIVEHLDPELEQWQALEYKCIHRECKDSGADFTLSGVANASEVRTQLGLPSDAVQKQSVEDLYSSPEARRRVCLLDPKGERDISPEDGELFDVFLFGGILGDEPPRERLDEIQFVDRPDIELPGTANGDGLGHPNESVSMPFKYVKGEDGKPVMPEGMLRLLVDDMDKGIDDLL